MHVGIIMNGNGRWAMRRGLPPTEAADSRMHLRIVIDYLATDCLWPDFTAHDLQRALSF
jgi:undecaprenyl pyrophosphate synthase